MIQLLLNEDERQLVMMALAALSIERPGFDSALADIAGKIDNIRNDRPQMYDDFRVLRTAAQIERLGNKVEDVLSKPEEGDKFLTGQALTAEQVKEQFGIDVTGAPRDEKI